MFFKNRAVSSNIEDRRGEAKINQTNPLVTFQKEDAKTEAYMKMFPGATRQAPGKPASNRSLANQQAEKMNKNTIETIWKTGGGF